MLRRLRRWKTLTMNWGAAGLMVAAVCLLFAVGMWVNMADAKGAAQMEIDRSRQLTELQLKAAELQKELDYVGSKEDIERRARTEHNYMKPGETRFHIENMANLRNYTLEEYREKMQYMRPGGQ